MNAEQRRNALINEYRRTTKREPSAYALAAIDARVARESSAPATKPVVAKNATTQKPKVQTPAFGAPRNLPMLDVPVAPELAHERIQALKQKPTAQPKFVAGRTPYHKPPPPLPIEQNFARQVGQQIDDLKRFLALTGARLSAGESDYGPGEVPDTPRLRPQYAQEVAQRHAVLNDPANIAANERTLTNIGMLGAPVLAGAAAPSIVPLMSLGFGLHGGTNLIRRATGNMPSVTEDPLGTLFDLGMGAGLLHGVPGVARQVRGMSRPRVAPDPMVKRGKAEVSEPSPIVSGKPYVAYESPTTGAKAHGEVINDIGPMVVIKSPTGKVELVAKSRVFDVADQAATQMLPEPVAGPPTTPVETPTRVRLAPGESNVQTTVVRSRGKRPAGAPSVFRTRKGTQPEPAVDPEPVVEPVVTTPAETARSAATETEPVPLTPKQMKQRDQEMLERGKAFDQAVQELRTKLDALEPGGETTHPPQTTQVINGREYVIDTRRIVRSAGGKSLDNGMVGKPKTPEMMTFEEYIDSTIPKKPTGDDYADNLMYALDALSTVSGRPYQPLGDWGQSIVVAVRKGKPVSKEVLSDFLERGIKQYNDRPLEGLDGRDSLNPSSIIEHLEQNFPDLARRYYEQFPNDLKIAGPTWNKETNSPLTPTAPPTPTVGKPVASKPATRKPKTAPVVKKPRANVTAEREAARQQAIDKLRETVDAHEPGADSWYPPQTTEVINGRQYLVNTHEILKTAGAESSGANRVRKVAPSEPAQPVEAPDLAPKPATPSKPAPKPEPAPSPVETGVTRDYIGEGYEPLGYLKQVVPGVPPVESLGSKGYPSHTILSGVYSIAGPYKLKGKPGYYVDIEAFNPLGRVIYPKRYTFKTAVEGTRFKEKIEGTLLTDGTRPPSAEFEGSTKGKITEYTPSVKPTRKGHGGTAAFTGEAVLPRSQTRATTTTPKPKVEPSTPNPKVEPTPRKGKGGTEAEVEAQRAEIRARRAEAIDDLAKDLNRPNMGVDPAILPKIARVIATYAEEGLLDFKLIARELRNRFPGLKESDLMVAWKKHGKEAMRGVRGTASPVPTPKVEPPKAPNPVPTTPTPKAEVKPAEAPKTKTSEPTGGKEAAFVSEDGVRYTGIKKAAVEQVREAWDLDPADTGAVKSNQQSLDRAVTEGYHKDAHGVMERAIGMGRALTPEETAGVSLRYAELINENKAAMDDVVRLRETGTPEEVAVAMQRVRAIQNEANELFDMSDALGRVAGQDLQARKIMVKLDDYSLMGLVRDAEKAKGKPLTDAERVPYEKLADDYRAATEELKRLQESDAVKDAKIKELEAERRVGEWVQEASKRAQKEEISRKTAKKLEDPKAKRERLKKELLGMGYRLNDVTGLGLEASYKIGQIARTYIDEGVIRLSDIVQKIQVDFPRLTVAQIHEAIITPDPARKGRTVSPEAQKWNAVRSEAGARAKTAALEGEIEAGTLKRREPPPKPYKSPEREAAEIKLRDLRRHAQSLLEGQRKWDASLTSVGRAAALTNNTLRTLRATADISATFRQGLILAARGVSRDPVGFAKIAVSSLKAMTNKYTFEQLQNGMVTDPRFYLYRKAKGHFSDLHGGLSGGEELYVANLLERVPYFKEIVAGSERHMTVYLNMLRTDAFYKYLDSHPYATTGELEAVANMINVFSGRGNLGSMTAAAPTLGQIFFAPRFAMSRIQAPFAPLTYIKNRPVAIEAAKSLAATAAFGGTIMMMAKLAGASVESDPRSSDWGKIRVGDTRFDVWGGMQQPMRQLMRFLLQGGKAAGWTEGVKGFLPEGEIGRFGKYKFSPLAGYIYIPFNNMKTVMGEDVREWGAGDWATNTLLPISVNDIVEAYKSGNTRATIGAVIASPTGVSVNTYETDFKRMSKAERVKVFPKLNPKNQARFKKEGYSPTTGAKQRIPR